MSPVARALIFHELIERGRDRWVLISSGLFALLAFGITAYGGSAEGAATVITAPSLVTLAAFLVPLVALILGHDAIVGERERHTLGLLLSLPVRRGEVLVAKFVGRLLALTLAVTIGLGGPSLLQSAGQRSVILGLIPSTLLLGASFLAIGLLISVISSRLAAAAVLSRSLASPFLSAVFPGRRRCGCTFGHPEYPVLTSTYALPRVRTQCGIVARSV